MLLRIFLLFSLAFALSESQEQCRSLARRVDRGFRTFFFIGDEQLAIPINKKDVSEHCRKPTRSIKALKKYKDTCTKGLASQILQVSITGVTSAVQSMCAPENQDKTVEINRCLTRESILSFHECFFKGEKLLEFVTRSANNSNILPLTCCAFNFVDKCVASSSDVPCAKSGVKVNEYFQNFFNIALDDVRDLACGRLKNLDKCEESYPRQTRRLRRIYNTNDGENRGNKKGSFIFSLVEISSRLGE